MTALNQDCRIYLIKSALTTGIITALPGQWEYALDPHKVPNPNSVFVTIPGLFTKEPFSNSVKNSPQWAKSRTEALCEARKMRDKKINSLTKSYERQKAKLKSIDFSNLIKEPTP